MEKNGFVKSHGLGNEYIVFDGKGINFSLSENAIRRICNVNFGIGSDGILLKTESQKADFGLRIFNPDGSEAEKSGNGLRIFCKYLYDYGFTQEKEFTVETLGGIVRANIAGESSGRAGVITVDMGKAVFRSRDIPVDSDEDEFIGQTIKAGDKEYKVNCVSVGNPHCVVIMDSLDVDEIKNNGPFLENHPLFPNRINVQFVKILSRNEARVLIWERGAGYTLASGSSSCAVACILVKLGLADQEMSIKMKGGTLRIRIESNWEIRMTGEVREIASGILSEELLNDLEIPVIV
jgi:diaminopimelate epimerase